MSEFRLYRKKQLQEARPYVPGEDLSRISVSPVDRERATLDGGWIARSAKNPDDQWYINPEFFAENYQILTWTEHKEAI